MLVRPNLLQIGVDEASDWLNDEVRHVQPVLEQVFCLASEIFVSEEDAGELGPIRNQATARITLVLLIEQEANALKVTVVFPEPGAPVTIIRPDIREIKARA